MNLDGVETRTVERRVVEADGGHVLVHLALVVVVLAVEGAVDGGDGAQQTFSGTKKAK